MEFPKASKQHPLLRNAALTGEKTKGRKRRIVTDIMGNLLALDISKRIKPGWEILPKRWVVERTLAWLNGFRRLSKDYEIPTSSEETHVIISHSYILLKRL